jgi:hypothetical protein
VPGVRVHEGVVRQSKMVGAGVAGASSFDDGHARKWREMVSGGWRRT